MAALTKRVFVVMAAVFLCSAFCLPPAEAALVPIAITADVTDVRDDYDFLEGKVNVGDLITGVYIYDSSTPDSDPREDVGIYEHHTPPYGATLTVGGFVFMADPDNVEFVGTIVDDRRINPRNDEYLWISYNNFPLSNSVPTGKISLHASCPLSLFSSDALPTTAPDLSTWGHIDVSLFGAAGEEDFYVRGDVTSAVLIPEPATFALLGIGTLVLLRSRERSSRTK